MFNEKCAPKNPPSAWSGVPSSQIPTTSTVQKISNYYKLDDEINVFFCLFFICLFFNEKTNFDSERKTNKQQKRLCVSSLWLKIVNCFVFEICQWCSFVSDNWKGSSRDSIAGEFV